MDLDQQVCLCFRVTRRKLEKYMAHNNLKVPSQLSECGGAGTGCGWCIPFLRQIFENNQCPGKNDVEALSHEDYIAGRVAYLNSGKGTPPAKSSDE